jgi:hypothetical protein
MSLVPRNTAKLKTSRILEHSLAGVKMWFEREWLHRFSEPRLTVVWSPTLDASKEVVKALGLPGPNTKDTTPWLSMVLSSMNASQGTYAGWQMQHVGARMGHVDGNNNVVYERVRPVDIGLGLRFRCLDEKVAMAFASMWVESGPSVRFDIQNKRTGSVVEITMMLDPNVTLPTPDMSGGQGEGIRDLETTVILKTYTGLTQTLGTVKALDLVTRIDDPNVAVEALRFTGNGRHVNVLVNY